MKILKILYVGLSLILLTLVSYSQDKRTTETKVADLLARLPSNDQLLTNKLMADMISLGETGIRQICNQVVPIGKGDDTRPRYAVESLSRYLSGNNQGNARDVWENICINYATEQTDYGVKDFFMKQLQQFGGIKSAEAMKVYLTSKELCNPALAVISTAGGKSSESILAESLKDKDLQYPAAIMNTLALSNSQVAVNEYISWAKINDINIKASAFNALARSGNDAAYSVLSNAAQAVAYRWEPSGATAALLNYASVVGQKPDIIKMLGQRSDPVALPLITTSLSDSDPRVRKEASVAIVIISGTKAIPALINYLMKFSSDADQEAAKSALMTVCGNDNISLIVSVLKSGNVAARKSTIELLAWNKNNEYFNEVLPFTSSDEEPLKAASVKALANLAGPSDLNKLIELIYVMEKQEYVEEIQAAIENAALQIPEPEKRSSIILNALQGSNQKIKLIPVLAKTGGTEALKTVLKEFENGNPDIRDVCFTTLTNWKDYSATSALYEICASGNKTYEGPAFEAFIRQIKSANI